VNDRAAWFDFIMSDQLVIFWASYLQNIHLFQQMANVQNFSGLNMCG